MNIIFNNGTTGVACKNTNRDFIGIELDEKYFEIAKTRINNTPQKPTIRQFNIIIIICI